MFEENLFEDHREVEYQHMLDSTDRHTLREDAYIEKIKALKDNDSLGQLVKHLTGNNATRLKPRPIRECVSKYAYRFIFNINGIPFNSTTDAAKHFEVSTTTIVSRCKNSNPKYAMWKLTSVAK